MGWSVTPLCVISALAILIAPLFGGCVTKTQADARARQAYLAGQQAAYASMSGQGQVVVIIGPVEHPQVPWVEGLTLAQAIATANYTNRHNPKAITIIRQDGEITVDPRDVLGGNLVPLQPGDRVMIQE
jgi:hypothetical protein